MTILFFFWNIFVICYCCWIYLLVALLEVWYSYMRGLTLSLQWFTGIPNKQLDIYSKHFFLFFHNENSRISAFTGFFLWMRGLVPRIVTLMSEVHGNGVKLKGWRSQIRTEIRVSHSTRHISLHFWSKVPSLPLRLACYRADVSLHSVRIEPQYSTA